MNTRLLLLTLLFLALLPSAGVARPRGGGGGVPYDRPTGGSGVPYDRPAQLGPGRGWGYSAPRPSYNYNRCYSRPAYYQSPVFFNTGFFSPFYNGVPYYGGYNYGGYNYGYSRPSYGGGGNPMVLPKWTTGGQPLQSTDKVEVEQGKPDVEVPEIK